MVQYVIRFQQNGHFQMFSEIERPAYCDVRGDLTRRAHHVAAQITDRDWQLLSARRAGPGVERTRGDQRKVSRRVGQQILNARAVRRFRS